MSQNNQRIMSILFFLLIVSACTSLVPIKVGPPEEITVEQTPSRIERGKYLANHVTVCIDCHATRNWNKYSGPIEPGTEGKGGELFDESKGLPGKVYSKNITPYAIGDWSDGELARAITSGVNKAEEALFPIMPYEYYSSLSQEDLFSIVAYIRTLKAAEYTPPKRKLNFPMQYIVRTIPKPSKANPEPVKTDHLAYGKYMTTISGCAGCHTPQDKRGQKIAGMDYAGGFKFPFPNGTVATSANITPDLETGMGNKTKENFIGMFKAYADKEAKNMIVPDGEGNTVMPWTFYAGMTEEDLGAIYDYLMTVKPVKNRVAKFMVSEN
ncbi:MAG: c-type cytochrome [Fidelibacterota bacterium]